jgi:hypothetical protein
MSRKLRRKKLLKGGRKCIKSGLRNSERMNLKRRRLIKDRLIFSNKSCYNRNKKMSKSKLRFYKGKILWEKKSMT